MAVEGECGEVGGEGRGSGEDGVDGVGAGVIVSGGEGGGDPVEALIDAQKVALGEAAEGFGQGAAVAGEDVGGVGPGLVRGWMAVGDDVAVDIGFGEVAGETGGAGGAGGVLGRVVVGEQEEVEAGGIAHESGGGGVEPQCNRVPHGAGNRSIIEETRREAS